MRLIVLSVSAALALAAAVAVSLVFGLPVWLLLLLVALVGGLAVFGSIMVGRNARSWAYAEREEDLYIKHGAAFKELIAVPYGRMQFVDITSGPVERAFGIASIRLHTASPGTSARIPGLPQEEAARLRDRLTSLGEAQAAGL